LAIEIEKENSRIKVGTEREEGDAYEVTKEIPQR